MRCKMKAMIMDMCILSHKTQCFLMFGHVVGVGAGKLRGLPVNIPPIKIVKLGMVYDIVLLTLVAMDAMGILIICIVPCRYFNGVTGLFV